MCALPLHSYMQCKGRALLSIQALAQFQLRGQSTREWAKHRWLVLPGSSSQGISSFIDCHTNGTNGTSVSFSWMANFVISSQSGDQP